MGVMDKYWADKNAYDKNHSVEMVKVRTDSPNFSLAILRQNIDNVDSMNDDELYSFISKSYKSILKNIFTGDNIQKYIINFQNARFLNTFAEVLMKVDDLTSNDIIMVNTLCYHYLTLPKDQQKQDIINRMLKLSSVVNRYYLPGLLGLGLNNNLASMLLIARFSDIDLNVCIKRVNFIIITQPKELMTEKMIEEIFRKLYDVMNIFYLMFPSLMMDVIPEYDENNEKTWWVTDEIDEVNSIMNLAILNILQNLPSQTIRRVIMNYSEGQSMVYRNRPVRFSLKNLSEDYYRINAVVNQLIYTESINVP